MALVRTQVQLTQDQDERLAHLAAASRRSKADLVREAVDLLLRSRQAGPGRREIRERARAAVGSITSRPGEPTDVSVNHDKYLADAFDHSRVGR